jgi:hypothetical protein
MSELNLQDKLTKLHQSHANFKIWLGSIIGIILIFYFFSYATLIDKVPGGMIWFEVVTSIIMVFALFKLNTLAYKWISFRFANKSDYKNIMEKLSSGDFDQTLEQFLKSHSE